MKWNWNFDKCVKCPVRFECFTDDRIHVRPVSVDIHIERDTWRDREMYKAEFHLPECLRLGLYKQIADTGLFDNQYPTMEGDGFKLGGVFRDEETEHKVTLNRSWVKFPNILWVTGQVRRYAP